MADTKICKCICCGTDVEVTKFASPLKTKCKSCKDSGEHENPQFITEIEVELQESASKKKSKTEVVDGNKKLSKCIHCGKDVWITKFGSHAKTVCDDCGGSHHTPKSSTNTVDRAFNIDLSKIDKSSLPSLDDLSVIPETIANKRLREVKCPACGHEYMRIIKITDGYRGLVIHYQCDNCYTYSVVSEQSKHRIVSTNGIEVFNYRGDQIMEMVSNMHDTQYKNVIEHLISILNDNNINIDGIHIPEYIYKNKMKESKKCVKECDIMIGFNNVKFIEKEDNIDEE